MQGTPPTTTTHLEVGVLYYTPEIVDDGDVWRCARVEARESVRREHHLVVVLAEQVEHVGYELDECVAGTVDECPWDLGLVRRRARRRDPAALVGHGVGGERGRGVHTAGTMCSGTRERRGWGGLRASWMVISK